MGSRSWKGRGWLVGGVLLGGALGCAPGGVAGEGEVVGSGQAVEGGGLGIWAGGGVSSLIAVPEGQVGASDPAELDAFGRAVSVSGERALVGAFAKELKGAAYVLVRNGGVWEQEAKLVAGDGEGGDNFGVSVSISGDTALVGATGVDIPGAHVAGAAYVFVRNGGVWEQEAKLLASDADELDQLGFAVTLSGDTALVSARYDDEAGGDAGAVYVFVRSGGVWEQEAKLFAGGAMPGYGFGRSVSLSGETALIGVDADDEQGQFTGAAYVFVRDGGVWKQEAKLLASDPEPSDFLGTAVALSGDVALVGAPGDDVYGSASGAVYSYVRSGGAWTQEAKLSPADGGEYDNFGTSMGISGDVAVVASPSNILGAQLGAAYVFRRSGAGWEEKLKLGASAPQAGDMFGTSVALSGLTAIAGSYLDANGAQTGSVHLFTLVFEMGEACGADAECETGLCVDGVCCDSACGGGADDCQACSVAAGAAVDGVCTIVASGTVCRAAAGDCDAPEVCDGAGDACPTDEGAPDGTPCAGGVCLAGSCSNDGGAGGGDTGGTSAGGSSGGGNTGGAGAGGGDTGGAGAGGVGTGGNSGGGNTGGGGEDITTTGCACRTAGAGGDGDAGAVLALLALGLVVKRRRREALSPVRFPSSR